MSKYSEHKCCFNIYVLIDLAGNNKINHFCYILRLTRDLFCCYFMAQWAWAKENLSREEFGEKLQMSLGSCCSPDLAMTDPGVWFVEAGLRQKGDAKSPGSSGKERARSWGRGWGGMDQLAQVVPQKWNWENWGCWWRLKNPKMKLRDLIWQATEFCARIKLLHTKKVTDRRRRHPWSKRLTTSLPARWMEKIFGLTYLHGLMGMEES